MPASAASSPPVRATISPRRSRPSSRISSRSARASRTRRPGSPLASPRRPITADAVERLEHLIDRLDRNCRRCASFILPGGSLAGALLHVARTVCRRAERRVIALGTGAVDPILDRVSEPTVGSALCDGAGGESPHGDAGGRVVEAALDQAYAACVTDARRHYENFPVASRLLPRGRPPACRRRLCLCAGGRRLCRRRRPHAERTASPARLLERTPAARRVQRWIRSAATAG